MQYQPGDTIHSKYRIEALIGQGAFGQVYRATHLGLNQPRALKILRKGGGGLGSAEYEHYAERFQLEAQLGAALNNPYVVQVHDFEQIENNLALVSQQIFRKTHTSIHNPQTQLDQRKIIEVSHA